MIESLAAAACGFNGDGDISFNALLANVFGERFGAHAGVKARVVVKRSAADGCAREHVHRGLPLLFSD